MNRKTSMLLVCLSLLVFVACTKEEPASSKTGASKTTPPAQNDQESHGAHGPTIELGTETIGGYTAHASRDQGQITPGNDAAIDVWLTGGTGKVIAVRFWIGTEDAAGSVKVKAEIENRDEPHHWHTHAEIPSSLPANSKLWVELEVEGQPKAAGSFDLKTTEGQEASGDMHGPQAPISAERCAKHNIPASRCAFCDPSLVEKLGFCKEHDIAEAWCTRCSPILIAAFKKEGDWCADHGLPKSQCKICKGEAAP